MTHHPIKPIHQGFTLIELLIVVAILSLLMATTVHGIASALASQRLSTATRQLSADLHQATQLAKKNNHPIQIRFYQLPPTTHPGPTAWRAYQICPVTNWNANGDPQISFQNEIQHLPDDIIITTNPTHNTLQNQPPQTTQPSPQAPNAPYLSYYLHNNSTTTLPTNTPTVLTLIRESAKHTPTTLPADFRTITIDPTTHQIRSY